MRTTKNWNKNGKSVGSKENVKGRVIQNPKFYSKNLAISKPTNPQILLTFIFHTIKWKNEMSFLKQFPTRILNFGSLCKGKKGQETRPWTRKGRPCKFTDRAWANSVHKQLPANLMKLNLPVATAQMNPGQIRNNLMEILVRSLKKYNNSVFSENSI